ncbi:hypothetical protein ACX31A_09640, partial [Dermacoccus nishinomiyaensis]
CCVLRSVIQNRYLTPVWKKNGLVFAFIVKRFRVFRAPLHRRQALNLELFDVKKQFAAPPEANS